MELSEHAITSLSWGVALSMLAWTAFLIQRKRRWLRTALRATGRVLRVESATRRELVSDSTRSGGMTEDDVTYYYPHVEFVAEDGTLFTFRSRESFDQSRFGLRSVTVLYERSAPAATARLEDSRAFWGPVSVLVFFTLAALGFAILRLFVS
jgi:hypothetical protein